MAHNPFEQGSLNYEMFAMAAGEAFTWSRRVNSDSPINNINKTKTALKRFVQGRLNIFDRNNDSIQQCFRMEQGIMQTRSGDILVIVALTKQ